MTHLSHGFGGSRAFFWRSSPEGLDECKTVTAFRDCMFMHRPHLGEHAHLPLRARNLLGPASCHQMPMRMTMTDMAMVYRRTVGAVRLSVEPRLASWEQAIPAR
jgi:hypothetical protein